MSGQLHLQSLNLAALMRAILHFAKRNSIGIILLVACVGYGVYAWNLPLTPERAQAALAKQFPELRDTPIVERDDGTVLIGDCQCDLSAGVWYFDPPRPVRTPLPPSRYSTFRAVSNGSRIPDGLFERDKPFGPWRVVR